MSFIAKYKKTIFEYALIFIIGVVFALSYTLFVTPNDFAPSGINGIAVMVQYKLGFSIGYMSLIINVPLCIFAYFLVDKKFAIKTLFFCVTYSLVYLFFTNVVDLSTFTYDAENVDTIYPVIIAGLISGVSYGMLFRVNACSGGTDIVGKYINKKNPFLNFFWLTFVLNAVIAATSYFVYAKEIDGTIVYDYKPVCLCLLYCFLASFIGNRIISGTKKAYKFIIITDHAEKIENEILVSLHHSATRLTGVGSFSHQEKQVLICVVNKHQVIDVQNMLKKYPDTFTFVELVDETIGNFKQIRR